MPAVGRAGQCAVVMVVSGGCGDQPATKRRPRQPDRAGDVRHSGQSAAAAQAAL